MTVRDWIQVGVVPAAVGAAIIALVIATQDRRAAQAEAAKQRQHLALRDELGYAIRLLNNTNRGGSTDALERSRLRAEALTLIGVLGEHRVPVQWKHRMDVDDKTLRTMIADDNEPEFKKWQYESMLAVREITKELDDSRTSRSS